MTCTKSQEMYYPAEKAGHEFDHGDPGVLIPIPTQPIRIQACKHIVNISPPEKLTIQNLVWHTLVPHQRTG